MPAPYGVRDFAWSTREVRHVDGAFGEDVRAECKHCNAIGPWVVVNNHGRRMAREVAAHVGHIIGCLLIRAANRAARKARTQRNRRKRA